MLVGEVGVTLPAAGGRPTAESGRWLAELELWFGVQAGKTRLLRRRHVGPLMVQRPFHPEADGTAHVYVLHPPGGVAGGDCLTVTCHVAPGARALLTAPGATKFYRSAGRRAESRTVIELGEGAVCEYLPQETIVFDGATAAIESRVELAPDATYVGWEFLSLGRPAAAEAFASGAVSQRIEIIRDGRPVWIERFALDGGSPLMDATFAFAGRPIAGTMICVGPMVENIAERIRAVVGQPRGHDLFSVSQLDQAIVCRYLGASMAEGKSLFQRAWKVLRELALRKPAVAPRIWST